MVKETSVMKKKTIIKDKLCLIFMLIFFNSSSLDLSKLIWLGELLMIGES